MISAGLAKSAALLGPFDTHHGEMVNTRTSTRRLGRMDIQYPGFGRIVVDGIEYDHDVVIEDGEVRARSKKPSKALRAKYGHTPLSEAERIPWSKRRLIIGSGYSARLPITQQLLEQAAGRGVDPEIMPTSEACALLRTLTADDANAILHVTC